MSDVQAGHRLTTSGAPSTSWAWRSDSEPVGDKRVHVCGLGDQTVSWPIPVRSLAFDANQDRILASLRVLQRRGELERV